MQPHDLEAEASILGAILLDQTALARVIEIVDAEDFYRENNGQIYHASVELLREGEPIDMVTLGNQLQKQGVLERVGGRAHLATLLVQTPTAANVEYYARIVKAHSYKRKLITTGGEVTALGYDDALDAEEALNNAQSKVFSIADQRIGSGMERLYDLLKPTMSRIDAQMASGGGVVGVPSGFYELDRITNGFKASDMIVIAGRPSMGKALALDTPIPTPEGWTTMGQLRVGDRVFDERGRPCVVTYATPVQHQRECFEVEFSDDSRIVADGDHLWATSRRADRERADDTLRVRDTRTIASDLRGPDGRLRHSIPSCGPFDLPELQLSVAPYALGNWLGDRDSAAAAITVSASDAERLEGIGGAGMGLVPGPRHAGSAVAPAIHGLTWPQAPPPPWFHERLRPLGVLGAKRIPPTYLRASASQRLALLRGLMDSDGHVDGLGHAEYCSTNQALAGDVLELVRSLGIIGRLDEGAALLEGIEVRRRYRVRFKTGLDVYRLPRKRERLRQGALGAASRSRRVRAVRPVPSVPVRCIQVDSPSHLYLAGESCIPTHNTSFVLNLALHAAVEHKIPVAIFSLEMSKEQLVERMLCEQARIDAQRLHRGNLSEREHEALVYSLGPLGDAPIYIDDTPMLDDLTLRLKARQASARNDIQMIIVDYLQLMHGRSSSGDNNRVQEVSQISRSMKAIARELRVPIIAISQLSRAPEQRPDKHPILSDLRESGSIEQDADLVMFLYRDDYYNREKSDKPGLAEVIIAKHRNGPTATIELKFINNLTRFENIDRRHTTFEMEE